MTATYTWDIFSSLDGFASYDEPGDWGGYWGKQGPEFLDRRLAQYQHDLRLVIGANTFRQFMAFIGAPVEELDPVNARMKSVPTTVISSTLEGLLAWPDATIETGDAVEIVAPLKKEDVPLRSHGANCKSNCWECSRSVP